MAIPLKYNLRSLLVRRVSTLMTLGGIALVVAVFVIVMALVAGLSSAIRDTGEPDNLVVLRKGVTTETYSGMSIDQFNALKYLPGIRRDAAGNPEASPELPVQVLLTANNGMRDNIILRGVLPVALEVHRRVHIVAGRMFNPGVREVIVGKQLVKRYRGIALGSTLRFGQGPWKVVGIFTAAGTSFESEIWADIHDVQDDTRRGTYYATARLTLAPGADSGALIRRISEDPRIDLQAETAAAYYADQSTVANELRSLGLVVALIMGIGAVFAAMNTMYAAVASRTTEIGTLRAIGFSPGAVMLSFLTESVILAICAGVVGVIIASPINGISTTFGNFVTFSTLAFNFRITWEIVVAALVFAIVMGALGGWLPARQAMRKPVIEALRRA